MSLVEGSGPYKCTHDHKDEFVTSDKAEYDKHLNDGKHHRTGTEPCAICDNPVNFENLTYGKKPICDDCKGELT